MNDRLTVIVSVQVGNINQLPALGNSAVRLQFEVSSIDAESHACMFVFYMHSSEAHTAVPTHSTQSHLYHM